LQRQNLESLKAISLKGFLLGCEQRKKDFSPLVLCSRFENKEQYCYICFMRNHNGMRPLDIVVLMKLIALKDNPWQYRDLSASLFISISEISASLNRSRIAGLVDSGRKKVRRSSLMEFIQYGLQYVFPQLPGPIVNGIETAHSHPFYKQYFSSDLPFVWPEVNGKARGQSIEPLHKGVVKAVQEDKDLYKLLASIDILRVGKVREKNKAIDELKKYIL